MIYVGHLCFAMLKIKVVSTDISFGLCWADRSTTIINTERLLVCLRDCLWGAHQAYTLYELAGKGLWMWLSCGVRGIV